MRYAVAFGVLLVLSSCGSKSDPEDQAAARGPVAGKAHDSDDDGPGVTLKKDAQARAGVRTEELGAQSIHAEVIAYGRLEEDPSEAFVVRAPIAGILRGRAWPSIGQPVAGGAELGSIEPRLALTDRIALNTQLATARGELNASGAAVAAAQKTYDRTRELNADNKNASDRALQEADAKLAAEKAREAGLRSSVQILESSLGASVAAAAVPVVAGRGGDAVEILAQPGESVEPGASLLRVARFDRLLARIDLPLGERSVPHGATVQIVPAGFDSRAPLTAEPVGEAATADPLTHGSSLLFRLTRGAVGLRPGTSVTARFLLPGSAAAGVLIPRAAIVEQDGRLWVYIQTKEDHFARRPVPLDTPAAAGFLASKGFAPGERIVVAGAQTLLSEEFKSQNEADTN